MNGKRFIRNLLSAAKGGGNVTVSVKSTCAHACKQTITRNWIVKLSTFTSVYRVVISRYNISITLVFSYRWSLELFKYVHSIWNSFGHNRSLFADLSLFKSVLLSWPIVVYRGTSSCGLTCGWSVKNNWNRRWQVLVDCFLSGRS